jgi:hypothetical protein
MVMVVSCMKIMTIRAAPIMVMGTQMMQESMPIQPAATVVEDLQAVVTHLLQIHLRIEPRTLAVTAKTCLVGLTLMVSVVTPITNGTIRDAPRLVSITKMMKNYNLKVVS